MSTCVAEAEPVIIVGGGFAGLVAACELKRAGVPVRVFEAGKQVGGLATSFHDDDGFSYDFGAHFITNRLAAALGVSSRCRLVRRYGECVWIDGKTYGFPFGLMRSPRYAWGALAARVGGLLKSRPPQTADQSFRDQYGNAMTDDIAAPLLEAWSGLPATELSPAVSDKMDEGLLELLWLKSAAWFTQRAVAIGYGNEKPQSAHVWHVYPEGGLGTIIDHLYRQVADEVCLEMRVESIVVENERVRGVRAGGDFHPAAAVLSTAPVNILSKLVDGSDKLDALADFRYRPMTFVNLRMQGRGLLPDVVLWLPEQKFRFFRVTEAPQSMPWLAPEGKTLLTVDIGCEVGDETWSADDETLAQQCIEGLKPVLPDAATRFLGARVLRTPYAYPVFDNRYEPERLALKQSTGIDGLHSIGRNGEFGHLLLEDLYWRTLAKARQVRGRYQADSLAVV